MAAPRFEKCNKTVKKREIYLKKTFRINFKNCNQELHSFAPGDQTHHSITKTSSHFFACTQNLCFGRKIIQIYVQFVSQTNCRQVSAWPLEALKDFLSTLAAVPSDAPSCLAQNGKVLQTNW